MNQPRTTRFLPLIYWCVLRSGLPALLTPRAQPALKRPAAPMRLPFMWPHHPRCPTAQTVSCRASIAPKRSVFEKLTSRQVVPESAPGTGVVANSSANCTVMVPYAASKSGSAAELNYHIDALTASGQCLHARRRHRRCPAQDRQRHSAAPERRALKTTAPRKCHRPVNEMSWKGFISRELHRHGSLSHEHLVGRPAATTRLGAFRNSA